MKTFYSILSAVINPISGEKISLGLLLGDGNRSFFDYSKNRLDFICSLISPDNKKFIKHYLKSIDNIIKHIDINQDEVTILHAEGKNLILKETYIEYLSIYSKNVISFSKPVSIDVNVEQGIFEILFSKFIDQETTLEPKQKSNIQLVKTDFCDKVKQYFTIEKEFTNESVPGLLLPVTIDLYGKNERFVIGKFLDLEKNIYHIKNDYYDYSQMAQLHKNDKKFIVSGEPQKDKFPYQHYFWNEIRNLSDHTFVDISEVSKIEEYAKLHNVLPV